MQGFLDVHENSLAIHDMYAWQDCPCQRRADLEPPKELGVGVGLGLGLRLGSGWSGPTCKVEIDHKQT